MEERYIASVDLGTSKFGLCVARVKGDDVQIVYYKETPADGMKYSLVWNPMKASAPLKKAIEDAEKELMIKILQVVVGLPRWDVRQEIANGKIDRPSADDFITEEEVSNLKSLALETYPLEDEKSQVMYGAVAQSFSVDDQIQMVEDDVVGAISSSLEGTFKVFIGSRKNNISVDKVFNTLGVAIAKKYFLPDVVAKAVLSDDEKQNGVALVDIGAGVTSVSIYYGGIMRSYAAIPFGGRSITGDIRSECSISEALAENIKKRFGACIPSKLGTLSEKVLQLRVTDPIKEVSVKYISEIIDARSREIMDAVLYYIQQSGFQNNLRSGIVLTGGGARLANLGNLLKDMSGYEIRPGYPLHKFSTSVNNVYELSSTAAIGMILAAKDDRLPDCVTSPEKEDEEETVVEEAPAQVIELAAEKSSADPGALFNTEEMGPVEKKKKKSEPRPKPEKKPKKEQTGTIIWNKLNNWFNEMTKDE